MSMQVLASGITYIPNFVMDPGETMREIEEQVQFQQRVCRVYGKRHNVPRLEAWFGPKPYTFSGMTFPAAEMPPAIKSLEIAASIRCGGGFGFDHCLANLYRDGSDTVGWHSDNEPEFPDPIIASVSFGASRDFLLRRKEPLSKNMLRLNPTMKNRIKITLEHGSLLVMGRGIQSEYEHSLPRRKRVSEPRINLTYRAV